MKIINYIVIALLALIRPLLGPASCKFAISCGEFALTELKEKPFLKAFWSICKRLFSCNPFNKTQT